MIISLVSLASEQLKHIIRIYHLRISHGHRIFVFHMIIALVPLASEQFKDIICIYHPRISHGHRILAFHMITRVHHPRMLLQPQAFLV